MLRGPDTSRTPSRDRRPEAKLVIRSRARIAPCTTVPQPPHPPATSSARVAVTNATAAATSSAAPSREKTNSAV